MIRDGSSATTPIADAVSWTKFSTQTKAAGQRDSWHSLALVSYVQSWVNDPSQNFGVMLEGVDDSATGPVGGLYYSASEASYGGETAARPNLVVTYDEPGVRLDAPSTIQASGPEGASCGTTSSTRHWHTTSIATVMYGPLTAAASAGRPRSRRDGVVELHLLQRQVHRFRRHTAGRPGSPARSSFGHRRCLTDPWVGVLLPS